LPELGRDLEIDERVGKKTLMTEHNRGYLRGTLGVVPVEQVLVVRFPHLLADAGEVRLQNAKARSKTGFLMKPVAEGRANKRFGRESAVP
jgi:hypothetical protein